MCGSSQAYLQVLLVMMCLKLLMIIMAFVVVELGCC